MIQTSLQPPIPFDRSGEVPLKVLLYGPPGVGKTTFAGGASDVGEVLFLNVEGGMLSLKPDPKIRVYNIGNSPDYSCIDYLRDILWAVAARDLEKNPWLKDVRTIVLDSGSEFLNMALEALVQREVRKSPKRDPNDVYLEDYGHATTALTRLFRHMRDLPYNVVITALPKLSFPKTVKDAELSGAEPIDVRPWFTQKLGNSLMGFMDNVWYMYIRSEDGKNVPYMLTQPIGVTQAKTRGIDFPVKLGSNVRNPNFRNVWQLLQDTE